MAARALCITLSNGTEHIVQPTLEDRLRFEQTLRRNRGWGDLKDNALKLEPFLAWSAATRLIEGFSLTWDEFTSGPTAALTVESVAEGSTPEEDELEVDGLGKDTQTEPSTSFPSS